MHRIQRTVNTEVSRLRIGIIGTGNMGSMLAKSLLQNGQHEILVFNRTPAKAHAFASQNKEIQVVNTLYDLVAAVDCLFLCTKPNDAGEVIDKIGFLLHSNQLLFTTISSLPLNTLRQMTSAPVIKIIPSLTQTVNLGSILVTFQDEISDWHRAVALDLLHEIAKPIVIDECQLRVCSDVTSCGPAFLAYILKSWAKATASTGLVSYDTAELMIQETLLGLAGLLHSGMTLSDILGRIAIPGGVTEAGIESLGLDPYEMFVKLHATTDNFQKSGHRPFAEELHGSTGWSNHVTKPETSGEL